MITEFYHTIFLSINRDELLRVLKATENKKIPSTCFAEKLRFCPARLASDNIPFSNVIGISRDGSNVLNAAVTKSKL